MKLAQYVRAATFRLKPPLERPEELEKMVVRVLVLLEDRTAVPNHAAFLMIEVRHCIALNKINQIQNKFRFLAVEIGRVGNTFKAVDVTDQRLVLRVDYRIASLKFFGPLQHGSRVSCRVTTIPTAGV